MHTNATARIKTMLTILGTLGLGLTLVLGFWLVLGHHPPVEARAASAASPPLLSPKTLSASADPPPQAPAAPETPTSPQQDGPKSAVALPEHFLVTGGAFHASAGDVAEAPFGNAPLMNPPMPGDTEFVVGMTEDRVWGVVSPGATVTVTVNGTQMGAARADGVGFFWTTLYDANGERPILGGGDTVAIYEDGALADSLTLRGITGNIDVLSETVTGTVNGLASSTVTLYPGFAEPSLTTYSQTITTDGSGNFTADFSANWNLVADERVVAAYVDGDTEVHQMLYAQRLIVQLPPFNAILGQTTPNTPVTATIYLSDGVSVRDQFTDVTDARSGRYEFSSFAGLPLTLEADDIVVVDVEGGDVLSRTVDTLSVTTEADADRVTGQAEPNANVVVKTSLLTPLGWKSVTAETTADATGAYTVELAVFGDVLPGRWSGAYVADAEGDDLNLWAPAQGSLEVNQTYNNVAGIVPAPPGPAAIGQPVTLTYYSAVSDTTFTYSKGAEWYGNYYFDQDDGLPDNIVPGDVITVETQGYAWQGAVEVQTMTVQADTANDRFTGSVEPPSPQVEVWGDQWDGWANVELFPIAGSFATSVTANSPFTASVPGIDVRNATHYRVLHRNADEYVEQLEATVDIVRVWPQYNGVLGTLNPPGVAYTLTLQDGSGGFKAQLTGNSFDPDGNIGFQSFWSEDVEIEDGDRLVVETAAGFNQTVEIPNLSLNFDEANDLLSGSTPANSLINLNVNNNEAYGFVPTDGSGAFKVALDEMQVNQGDGDLSWGDWTRICYADENWNHVCRNFSWPQIIANYDMSGYNQVWGHNAIPGNTIVVTLTAPGGSVIATGTTTAGACNWCGPTQYQVEFPDNTLQDGYTVTAQFGDNLVDSTVVVSITASPDADTDLVTGTAPANSVLHANAQHIWGDWIDINDVPVDASGVYTIDFGAEGWDIQYGDSFNIHLPDARNHQTQYSFSLPAPELSINKWNTNGYARPGGVVVYGINYWNDGNGTAEDTTIVDTLPASTTWAGDTSGVVPTTGAGGVITWNLGDVEAYSSGGFIVTLDVLGSVPTGTAVIGSNCAVITTTSPGDYDPGNNGPSCTGSVDVWDDEVEVDVHKWPHPSDPAPGEAFEYHINTCNNRGAATGPVWLTDTLPLSTTFVAWGSDYGDTTYWTEVVTTGGQVVLTAPGLPGDTCERLRLRLKVDAPISTTLENTIVITTAGDVDPDNNEDTDTDAHVSSPRYDLYVDKNFNNGDLTPGGHVEYGIYYQNQGNSAVHAWLTDTLPAGTSFDQAWSWGIGLLPPDADTGDTVVWDLGELGVNEDMNFNIRLNIDETAATGLITNCVTIGSAEPENTPYNNEDCVSHQIYADGPNLSVTKDHEWHGDGQLGYNINVLNLGDETLYDVVVTDTYPLSTTFNGDWRFPGYPANVDFTDNYTNGQVIWTLEQMEPGWGFSPRFNVDLDNPGELMRWYTNTVEVPTPTGDPTPADNVYTDVAFSGGEVDRVNLNVNGTHIEGCGYSDPVTVTTANEERTYGGDCWDDTFNDPFLPGDVVTVASGAGTHPVVITIPDPFTAYASSITDTVWGQIDALDHEQVNVSLDNGPYQNVQTDGSGNYSVTFSDVPRGGRGWVNYQTTIDYADVHFHRQFQSLDLLITVDYAHDWIGGHYDAGHTIWLTDTESDGSTIKATATLSTSADGEWWSTNPEDWSPSRPDIESGDWIYGLVNSASYTTSVRVGTIDGAVDTDSEVVSGTIHAPWLAPDLVNVECEIHEENGPNSIHVPNVDPNGGTFYCDFSGEWDIEPGHNVAVNYTEPDGDRVQTHPSNPAPYLRLNKNGIGSPGEGGNFGFQIQYSNDGGADAENTVITDTLLHGMTYLTDTSGLPHSGSGAPGDPLVWHLGTLPGNSSGQFAVMVEVTATAGTRITNTAQITTSNPYDQGDFWDKYSESSEEVQSNDTHLNVDKWAWTGDPAPGYDVVYSVNVCNNGSTGSNEVTLTDTLHPSMTLQTWWGQHPGWTEVLSGSDKLVVSHPSIPGWWCSEVYLSVHLSDAAWPGMTITNTAIITAGNDLESDDNETTWEGQVGDPHTNLYINKHWNWGQLVPGGEIRYNIDYQNNGNVPVTSTLRITDTLPVSATFVAAWEYDPYGNPSPVTPIFTGTDYVVWEIDELPNGFGDNFEIALDVDGDAVPGTVLTNTVEISPQPNEEDYDDNVETVVETVNDHGPNLRVRKEGNWDDWGENTRRASYNLTVENVGDAPVAPVVITDTYDSKMYVQNGCDDIGVNYWRWWDCRDDAANHTFTVTLDSLRGGERIDIDFGTITDTEPLPFGLIFTNTAEVTLHPDDVNRDDNVDDVVLTTGPDLFVEKELVAGELLPGELITFSLRFGNDHQGHEWWWNTQGSAWVTETLPSGFEFITATRRTADWAPYAPDYDDGTHLAWDTGDMPAGGEDELHVTVRIPATATGLDTFTNHVEIASDQPISDTEPYYTNNSDAYDVLIALPTFEVGKSYESSEIAGLPVTYTLTVTNTGNAAGTNVVLSDTVPAGLSGIATDGSYAVTAVTWSFSSIASQGGTATGWFSGILPCSGTVTNDDYRVVGSDEGVDSATGASVAFTVNAPTLAPNLDQSATSIMVNDTVSFTDTSTTDGPDIVAWEWDFGDGSAHDFTQDASHTYTSDGAFTVTLTVTDTCGYTDSKTAAVTVSAPTLVADFDHSPDPANILTGQSVDFTDTSTTDGPTIVAWAWDFGDGGTSTLQNPTHTYNTVGTFDVTLTVTDTLGYSDTEIKADLVTVASRCTPLSGVSFAYTPLKPTMGEVVTFDADFTPITATTPLTYTWTFGDGASVTLYNQDTITHTYAVSGTQSVQLTVYNPCTPSGVTTQETLDVAPHEIYLPLILRNHS